MIFVTVGTHEQQFNRLIKEIDEIKKNHDIGDVIIQRGYSTYEPLYCEYSDFFSYDKIEKYMEEANIIITHGGPASFIAPLTLRKKVIVVPRQVEFHEHVNDHQLTFCKEVAIRGLPIIVIENINDLKETILNYNNDQKIQFESNNKNFVKSIEETITKYFM